MGSINGAMESKFGKLPTWGAMCVDIFAPSYISSTSIKAGEMTSQLEKRKRRRMQWHLIHQVLWDQRLYVILEICGLLATTSGALKRGNP